MPDTTLANNARKVAEAWPGITAVTGQTRVRNIANTSKVSEHVFGNALDIFGSRKGMSSLAAHLNGRRSDLSIRTLCYDGGPGPSYDGCTTPHLDHIHISFVPKCRGNVATTGDADERRNLCEAFQQGGNVTTGGSEFKKKKVDADAVANTGDGLFGIPGALDRFTESLEITLQTTMYVLLGVVVLGVGVAVAIRGNDTFKTIQKVATKAATKGAI